MIHPSMNRGFPGTTRPGTQSQGDEFFDGEFIIDDVAARPQPTSRWITALLALALAGTLAGYQVISFLPELLGVDSRVVTVPFRAILAGLYLMVLFLGFYSRCRVRLSLPMLALSVFLVLYTMRLLLDTVIAPVPLELPPEDYIAYFLGMSLLPIITFLLAPKLPFGRWAFGFALLLTTLACVLSVIYSINDSVTTRPRMVGNESLNPITLGHTGVSLFLDSTLWFVRRRGDQ